MAKIHSCRHPTKKRGPFCASFPSRSSTFKSLINVPCSCAAKTIRISRRAQSHFRLLDGFPVRSDGSEARSTRCSERVGSRDPGAVAMPRKAKMELGHTRLRPRKQWGGHARTLTEWKMEYSTSQQMQHVAEVFPELRRTRMSRSERLMRWAELLCRDPARELRTLIGTEFYAREDRSRMRSDSSPITVALEDAVLRAEGLQDDSYGEAVRFFELTDGQMHRVLCHCHFGPTVKAATVGRRIAGLATKPPGTLFERAHQALLSFGRR